MLDSEQKEEEQTETKTEQKESETKQREETKTETKMKKKESETRQREERKTEKKESETRQRAERKTETEQKETCYFENGIAMCILPEGRRPNPPEPLKVKSRWRPPGKDIFRPFLEAAEKFGMVKDGDRVLVCLSGGKDSLSLLHTMRQYQVK